MNWPDVVLVVAVSAVTSFLVTVRGQLLALLPRRRPKPVDPELLMSIYQSAARSAGDAYLYRGEPSGTPPSVPRPPVE